MEEFGECIDIIYAHVDQEGKHHYYSYGHDVADGLGSFASLLRDKYSYHYGALPTVSEKSKPGILKRILLALKHIYRQRSRTYNWKQLPTDKSGRSVGCSYIMFSKEQTDTLNKLSKARGMNANSVLLTCLDRVSAKKFIKEDSLEEQRVWMLPVSMRSKNEENLYRGNYVTALSVYTKSSESPESIYGQLRSMLKSGIIWGGIIIANTPKYIGEKRLRQMAPKIRSPYFGLLSNIGSWPKEGDNLLPNDSWFLIPPATKFTPVASACITWQGQLSLCCQLHQSISSEMKDVEELISELQSELTKELSLDEPIGTVNSVSWEQIKSNVEKM
jgi:hypothetical protein